MDSSTREMLAAAFAEDDKAQADYARWERERQTKQQPPVQRRSAPGEIVYKTYHRPQPQQSAQQMDQRTTDEWNAWANTMIERAIGRYDEHLSESLLNGIGEAFSIERKDTRKYIDQELQKLREEIGALRADLTLATGIQRGIVTSLRGNVAPIVRANKVGT